MYEGYDIGSYVPMEGVVLRVTSPTPKEKIFQIGFFDPEGRLRRLYYQEGQFVRVTSTTFAGASAISITSTYELTPYTIDLGVRKIDGGRVTPLLHELDEGDPIYVEGPFGKPVPSEFFAQKVLVFVLGGTGLFPGRASVNKALAHREKYERIVIVFANPTPEELYFPEEFKSWEQDPLIQYYMGRGRPTFPMKGKREVDVDGANNSVVPTIVQLVRDIDLQHCGVLLAGPHTLYQPAYEWFHHFGVPDDKIWATEERNMDCCRGTCGKCQCGPKLRACVDGPVMPAYLLRSTREGDIQ